MTMEAILARDKTVAAILAKDVISEAELRKMMKEYDEFSMGQCLVFIHNFFDPISDEIDTWLAIPTYVFTDHFTCENIKKMNNEFVEITHKTFWYRSPRKGSS